MNGIVWDVVYVNRVGLDGYGGGYRSVVGDVVVNINEGIERFENGVGRRRREYRVDACVRREPFFLFCNTSPKSLLESPREASPSYRVSPTSQVTVSGWGSREEKGAVDSGFAFVQNI